jgi:hypothetical protein
MYMPKGEPGRKLEETGGVQIDQKQDMVQADGSLEPKFTIPSPDMAKPYQQ